MKFAINYILTSISNLCLIKNTYDYIDTRVPVTDLIIYIDYQI